MKLAIRGGEPAVTQALPAWPPDDLSIQQSIQCVFDNNTWGNYHGPATEQLCENLCKTFSRSHAWTCSSGTIAVELALRGLKIDSGKVVLAGYDFPGNYRAIESVGATPHLVDIGQNSFTIDFGQLDAAIDQNTKAIIFSHLHGELADATRLEKIAQEKNVFLIEDACQCPGASLDSRPVGSFGDVSVFSFGGSKLLTSGRGGCVLTDDKNILQRIKIYSERGNDAFPLSQLQAAVLIPQLETLETKNKKRQMNLKLLFEQATSFNVLRLALPESLGNSAFYKVPFWVPADDRQFAIEALEVEGIPTGPGFNGFVQRAKSGRCTAMGSLGESQRVVEETVLLHHPFLLSDSSTFAQVLDGLRKIDDELNRAETSK